jgi:DNA mismatch repair protein MutS
MSKDKSNNKSLYEEYLEIRKEYEKKYDNVIVMAEIGEFCETMTLQLEEAEKWSEITGIQISDNSPPITHSNPYVVGCPYKNKTVGPEEDKTAAKYMDRLIQADYTIVMWMQVNQSTETKGRKKREVYGVFSKSTFTNMNQHKRADTQIMMNVLIEYYQSEIESINISYLDVFTGNNACYIMQEPKLVEINKILQSVDPKEAIFYIVNCPNLNTEIAKYDIYKKYLVKYLTNINESNFNKPKAQNNYLNEVFTNMENTLNGITSQLKIDKYPNMIISYIQLLEFAKDHSPGFIKNIKYPDIIKSSNVIELSENAILQLNILELYNLLKTHFLNPLKDSDEIQLRYNHIKNIMPIWKHVEKYLKSIKDLERLHRRIYMLKLTPNELYNLYNSYLAIDSILDILESNLDLKLDEKTAEQFQSYLEYINSIFIIENLKKYDHNSDECITIFKPNINSDIDNLSNKSKDLWDELNGYCIMLNSLSNNDSGFTIRYTKTDGYHITSTSKKATQVVDILKNKNLNWQFTKNTNIAKIKNDRIILINNELLKIQEQFQSVTREMFYKICDTLASKYSSLLDYVTKFVNNLDVAKSHAKVSELYNYTRPIIDSDALSSSIEATEVRHPIIEILDTSRKYVANDIHLNNSGMVLYGVNSSGKTSYGRMIGCCQILAQIGSYVPAKSYKYSLFKSIMTKIAITDNLFKNQSTYHNEILEIKYILENADQYSLIIADELCSGTAPNDALGIVGSTIINLSQKNSNFVFTTHLFDLMNIEEVKSLKNVEPYHMYINLDYDKREIIFDRILKPGCCQSEYGIEYAEFLQISNDVIKLAYKIRDGDLGKTSRYNNSIKVQECYICHKKSRDSELHTHHIKFQKDFSKKDKHKNMEYNLVVLCNNCHEKVHQNKITINGYLETSNGLKLDFLEN